LESGSLPVELGCTLNFNQHGKGFATEALAEILNLLFQKLNKHRVIASIDPRNEKSIRLVERLGMRKEAHFRKSLWMNNEWVDDLVYAILKEDWLEK
jgi:RimJ/RimL family protein N-acetyltransferase